MTCRCPGCDEMSCGLPDCDECEADKTARISPGQTAYAAYGEVTGGKNYQGLPMPEWSALPGRIREAWENSAEAVIRAFKGDD